MRRDARVGYVLIGRNEGERLKRALRAIDCAAEPVVYVDSGSTDGSVAFAQSVGAEVVDLDTSMGFTAARARNAGARRLFDVSLGVEFVQFIDGDCELQTGYIEAALEALDGEADLAVVSGRRRERHPEASVYNALIDLEWDTPVGEVRACHGDATVRRSAFEAVGGFRDTMIAGEEPEMCVRLRAAGWRLRRIDREMTLHDADLTRWGQWWKRAVRAGHAYAEGFALHGRGPARHNASALKSIGVWSVGWPLVLMAVVVLAVVWPWAWVGVAAVLALPGLMVVKIAWGKRRSGVGWGLALAYGWTCVACKWANAVGVATYLRRRRQRGPVRLIEYKGADEGGRAGGAARVAYVASVLPKRSETFVYRELMGLAERGVGVEAVSLYSPERGLGDERLDAIADSAVTVYADGWVRLGFDVVVGLMTSARTWGAIGRGVEDALGSGESLGGRVKAVVQAAAGVALARRLRGRGVDHLHAHFAHAPASVAMYAARAMGVSFSFTGHAADLFRDAHLLGRKLRRAAFVACISEWHRGYYRGHYRGMVERDDAAYPVIRCGVAVREPVAAACGDEAGPTLATVARLVPKKGIDTLIDALAEVRKTHAGCRAIVGGDGPELGALRARAAELGLADAVEFRGAVAHADVPGLLAEADVFVLPCRPAEDGDRDGIPVALMEAMSAEVCVVSGDLPTIRELIEDGVSGRMVEPGDAAALAATLREVLSDDARRAELAAAGRRRVVEEFSDGVNVDRLVAAFSGAMGRPMIEGGDRVAGTDCEVSADASSRASTAGAEPAPELATTGAGG
ncbi:MAG: glycosyltransferase [Planctomycetota bacterium]